MKKHPILISVVCVVVLAITMYHFSLYEQEKDLDKDQALSYEEYSVLYEMAKESLNIGEHYEQLIPEKDSINITYISEESSFGKRNYLTIDNAPSENVTQKRLEYLSEDGNFLISIDFIYQPVPLENDMLYWACPIDTEKNKFLWNTYDGNLLAYKNILISTSIYATGSVSIDPIMLTKITNQTVDFLQKWN